MGSKFIRKLAVATAKDQYAEGRQAWERSVMDVSMRCSCFLSTKPFCWGVWGQESWWMMPLDAKKDLKTLEVYLPPPSDLKSFILEKNLSLNHCLKLNKFVKNF